MSGKGGKRSSSSSSSSEEEAERQTSQPTPQPNREYNVPLTGIPSGNKGQKSYISSEYVTVPPPRSTAPPAPHPPASSPVAPRGEYNRVVNMPNLDDNNNAHQEAPRRANVYDTSAAHNIPKIGMRGATPRSAVHDPNNNNSPLAPPVRHKLPESLYVTGPRPNPKTGEYAKHLTAPKNNEYVRRDELPPQEAEPSEEEKELEKFRTEGKLFFKKPKDRRDDEPKKDRGDS